MPDQSIATIIEVEKKVLNGEVLNLNEMESLKIAVRNPQKCRDLTDLPKFIEQLSNYILLKNDCNQEILKTFINIATNEPKSRQLITEHAGQFVIKAFEGVPTKEAGFLLFRLLFLLTIDNYGSKVFSNCDSIESYASKLVSKISDEIRDDCIEGQIVVEILRFRYNLIRNSYYDHFKAVKEIFDGILIKCKIEKMCVNIIGSSLNVCLGQGPENVLFEADSEKLISILDLMIEMYLNNENKDYLGTVLMISLKFIGEETSRKRLRCHFLRSKSGSDSREKFKKLLVVPDTTISFLTGEFLLKLCKGNVARLLRHVGFESAAGFLYSKGLFKGGAFETDSVVDPDGKSSDEEYFNSNPIETVNHTPLIPETEEETRELEYLMQKITEYNERIRK